MNIYGAWSALSLTPSPFSAHTDSQVAATPIQESCGPLSRLQVDRVAFGRDGTSLMPCPSTPSPSMRTAKDSIEGASAKDPFAFSLLI